MKRIAFFLVVLSVCILSWGKGVKGLYLLETRNFVDRSDWRGFNKNGWTGLQAPANSQRMAGTIFEVPEEGEYNVWIRAYDSPKDRGSRKVKVLVNDDESLLAGPNKYVKKDGFVWDNIGKTYLNKGVNFVFLKKISSWARIDAILFAADDDYIPDKAVDVRTYRAKIHVPIPDLLDEKLLKPFKLAPGRAPETPETFEISNAAMKIKFSSAYADGQEKYFRRSVELSNGEKWISLPVFDDESVYVGCELENPQYFTRDYFSMWRRDRYSHKIEVGDKTYKLFPDDLNPYIFEKAFVGRPVEVKKLSDKELLLKYSDFLSTKVSLVGNSPIMKVEATFDVPQDGYYTIGTLGFRTFKPEEVESVQMPPLFQRRVLMESPKQIGNVMMSHPLTLIQAKEGDKSISYALVADPKIFPHDEWSIKGNSRCGFSNSDPFGAPRLSFGQPVLGGIDSFKKKGEKLTVTWYAISVPGDWTKAMRLANTEIFSAGNIFRHAYDVSFSDAVANIATYLKTEDQSGWIRYLGGRVNIEGGNLVTNATPNTELEIALITNDESYFKNISLRVIEFALSRRGYSFNDLPGNNAYGATQQLFRRTKTQKADYFYSLNALLRGANPFLKEHANVLEESSEDWVSLMGAYLANPSDELLAKIKPVADKALAEDFAPKSTDELDYRRFINTIFYPNWTYIYDLYKATGDKKYLEYARKGAYHSLASVWGYPIPPKGEITINKGNKAFGLGRRWTYMDHPYKLGFEERMAYKNFFGKPEMLYNGHNSYEFVIPEKKVDAMKVARIGITMEQPCTFIADEMNHLNIMMPSFAPEMLAVANACGDDVLKNFSRHCIVGRYSNFLGYYVVDYIDVMHDPMYPYRGPDMTSFYYHHAPCQFAQSFDYLMTQFEIASKGNMKFPYVRQKGYAWFMDRIFGMPGTVYGESPARVILDKTAVRPDTVFVSSLCARTPEAVWVLLLNDSNETIKTRVEFDPTSKTFDGALTDKPCQLYNADGSSLRSLEFFGEKQISIPAQGLVAIRVPAEKAEVFKPMEPIKSKAIVEVNNADKTFGDFTAYRIRGPFGSDALYAHMQKGAGLKTGEKFVVKLTSPSQQTIVCDRFPFEVSVYPLSQKADIKGEAFIESADSTRRKVAEFTLGQ